MLTSLALALLLCCSAAALRAQGNYLAELSNRVAAFESQPGWIAPQPIATFTLASSPVESITPAPLLEDPSPAAERWLQRAYQSNRWGGATWFLITPRGICLPVEHVRGVAPGLKLELIGLLPRGYALPLPPDGDGAPDAAPFAQVALAAAAVRGWTTDEVFKRPVTRDAFRQYTSAQSLIVTRLTRVIYASPTVPSSTRLAALNLN